MYHVKPVAKKNFTTITRLHCVILCTINAYRSSTTNPILWILKGKQYRNIIDRPFQNSHVIPPPEKIIFRICPWTLRMDGFYGLENDMQNSGTTMQIQYANQVIIILSSRGKFGKNLFLKCGE